MLHLLLQQQVASVLSLSSPPSAPAPVVEYIASTPAVYAAPYLSRSTSRCTSTGTVYFVRYICTCGGVNAPAPAVYAAPAPPVEYIASAQSVSYAAPALVLCTLCQRLYPMPHLLRLQQVASVLSLPSPPSTPAPVVDYIATVPSVHVALALVVDYIAPAPSGYATPALLVMYIAPASAVNVAPRLLWSTSRQHKQCLTRRRFLSRRHMSDDVFLRQGVESNALLSLSWSIPFIIVTRCR